VISRIHVTVVLLKPFWKAARDFLLTLFHPKRDSLSALNIYMLLFLSLTVLTLVCAISEASVSVLSLLQVDTKLYGLNFLRIGSASAAANNDLPDRVIKKHGRWKPKKAKDTYCREDIQHQL